MASCRQQLKELHLYTPKLRPSLTFMSMKLGAEVSFQLTDYNACFGLLTLSLVAEIEEV